MCSRFHLLAPPHRIVERFGLRAPLPNLPENPVRPTGVALTITAQGPRLLRFGLRVDWDARPVINARAESVARKPTFRPLLSQRCLVPSTAWTEWQSTPQGKVGWRMRPAEAPLFALAGLMRGEEFVLLTCPACPDIRFIHDRMPVVLPPAVEAAWLDSSRPFATLAPLLASYPAAMRTRREEEPAQSSLFD